MRVENTDRILYISSNATIKRQEQKPVQDSIHAQSPKTNTDIEIDDGKISGKEKVKSFAKGIISPITSMFSSKKNFAVGAAMIAGAAALCLATGGAAAPVLLAVGAGMSGVQLTKGTYKASTAKTDEEAKLAWEDIGAGTSGVTLSVVGAKASIGSAAKSGVQISGNAEKMSALRATAECFKPKTIISSSKRTTQMLTNGEAKSNLITTSSAIKNKLFQPKITQPITTANKPRVAVIDMDYAKQDIHFDVTNGVRDSHGGFIEKLIKANIPDAEILRYDVKGSSKIQALKDLIRRVENGEQIDAVNISMGDQMPLAELNKKYGLNLTRENFAEQKWLLRDILLKRNQECQPVAQEYTRIFNEAKQVEAEAQALYTKVKSGELPENAQTSAQYSELSARINEYNDKIQTLSKQLSDNDFAISEEIRLTEELTSKGVKIYNSAGNNGAEAINRLSVANGVESIGAVDATGTPFKFSANNSGVRFEQGLSDVHLCYDQKGRITGYSLTGKNTPELTIEELGIKPWQNEIVGQSPEKILLSELEIQQLMQLPRLQRQNMLLKPEFKNKLISTKDYAKIYEPTNPTMVENAARVASKDGFVTPNGIEFFNVDADGLLIYVPSKNSTGFTKGTSFAAPMALIKDIQQARIAVK